MDSDSATLTQRWAKGTLTLAVSGSAVGIAIHANRTADGAPNRSTARGVVRGGGML